VKALWVTASPVGPSARILGVTAGTSGGWVQTIYEEIRGKGVSLDFLCYSKDVKLGEIRRALSDEGEKVYCLNMPKVSFGVKPSQTLIRQIEGVISELNPDIIQIWGTETVVQNAVASCAPQIPKVVFLQGLIGMHSRYYGGNLKALGLRIIRKPKGFITYIVKKKHFSKQADFEKKELREAGNVILDNDFSIAYCKSVDLNIKSYKYRLNANQIFEQYEWSVEKCQRHRIFTVFGGGPDKGLQQLIRAVALVKQKYSDVEIVIPGIYHIDEEGRLRNKETLNSFERLMNTLINDLGLHENVVFCGRMSPEGMAQQIAKANCFVSPSIMEVHAGSLREAMTVGIPSISTFCGSVVEFIQEGVTGWMYRYEEHEVLAYKIIKLFENDTMASHVGKAAREEMFSRKKAYENVSLIDIYEDILATHNIGG
jgi:glycosyltransferase involved in cell wall biosynthesis